MVKYTKLVQLDTVNARENPSDYQSGRIYRSEDSAEIAHTLLELDDPKPFKFYDYVGIRNFAQTVPDTVHVSVAFSFLEPKQKVEAVGHFYNKSSGDYLGSVTFPAVADAVDDVLRQYVQLDSQTSFADLAVRVDLKTCDNGGTTTFHIVDGACAGGIVGLEPRYTHVYPKKEEKTISFR
ncbi:MAG: hypothetical protein LBP35_02395 [Candidatus Ancillula trichonymphae]|jgi:hypothetical protein|nr:hypothetical protein [Candidatus Ancillula trichonymphae]